VHFLQLYMAVQVLVRNREWGGFKEGWDFAEQLRNRGHVLLAFLFLFPTLNNHFQPEQLHLYLFHILFLCKRVKGKFVRGAWTGMYCAFPPLHSSDFPIRVVQVSDNTTVC
jgi:hypothetical protein